MGIIDLLLGRKRCEMLRRIYERVARCEVKIDFLLGRVNELERKIDELMSVVERFRDELGSEP